MQSGIKLENLYFSRNKVSILEGVNFEIQKGSFVGLIGPNGAGKSTLLKLAVKLLRPQSGRVLLDGKSLTEWDHKSLAQRIAYLPQNPKLEGHFSCLEIVLMGRYARLGRFQNIGKADLKIAKTAMSQTETADYAERLFSKLSGGQKQRVLLARAMAQEADFFLLDEPTASLDLHYQLRLLALTQSLAKAGRSICMAIHDLNMAARFCDRLILMNQGRIVADGPPATVLTEAQLASVYQIRADISVNNGADHLSIFPSEALSKQESRHA